MEAQVLTPVGWDQARWLGILERMEYRRADIGLRFWGPPLWLEVTMTGPDSDAWFSAGASAVADQSWDWQSTEPCTDAMALAEAGADDEGLLRAASRYTVQNLILNATHEIGEWLRFDAQRPFAAHGPGRAKEVDTAALCDGVQGNGSVRVDVCFGPPEALFGGDADDPSESALDRMAVRVNDLAASWRFSYLPGKMISYSRTGPAVTDSTGVAGTGLPLRWTSPWSHETLRLVAAPVEEFVAAVQRDVHRMLVRYETHRICDEFYVDGVRTWQSGEAADPPAAHEGADGGEGADGDDGRQMVTVAISYDG